MPVYEYECTRGHEFERVVQVSKDEPKMIVSCPTCARPANLQVSMTGKPILKAGIGGFFKPNA